MGIPRLLEVCSIFGIKEFPKTSKRRVGKVQGDSGGKYFLGFRGEEYRKGRNIFKGIFSKGRREWEYFS
ncbi:MAG: hypothetical protein C6I01_06755 [Epsilonproteobacteria bacterium]|nr:hypothetical protein [Campylobacterota bacterium]